MFGLTPINNDHLSLHHPKTMKFAEKNIGRFYESNTLSSKNPKAKPAKRIFYENPLIALKEQEAIKQETARLKALEDKLEDLRRLKEAKAIREKKRKETKKRHRSAVKIQFEWNRCIIRYKLKQVKIIISSIIIVNNKQRLAAAAWAASVIKRFAMLSSYRYYIYIKGKLKEEEEFRQWKLQVELKAAREVVSSKTVMSIISTAITNAIKIRKNLEKIRAKTLRMKKIMMKKDVPIITPEKKIEEPKVIVEKKSDSFLTEIEEELVVEPIKSLAEVVTKAIDYEAEFNKQLEEELRIEAEKKRKRKEYEENLIELEIERAQAEKNLLLQYIEEKKKEKAKIIQLKQQQEKEEKEKKEKINKEFLERLRIEQLHNAKINSDLKKEKDRIKELKLAETKCSAEELKLMKREDPFRFRIRKIQSSKPIVTKVKQEPPELSAAAKAEIARAEERAKIGRLAAKKRMIDKINKEKEEKMKAKQDYLTRIKPEKIKIVSISELMGNEKKVKKKKIMKNNNDANDNINIEKDNTSIKNSHIKDYNSYFEKDKDNNKNDNEDESEEEYECDCGKNYMTLAGFVNHKKNCDIFNNENADNHEEKVISNIEYENSEAENISSSNIIYENDDKIVENSVSNIIYENEEENEDNNSNNENGNETDVPKLMEEYANVIFPNQGILDNNNNNNDLLDDEDDNDDYDLLDDDDDNEEEDQESQEIRQDDDTIEMNTTAIAKETETVIEVSSFEWNDFLDCAQAFHLQEVEEKQDEVFADEEKDEELIINKSNQNKKDIIKNINNQYTKEKKINGMTDNKYKANAKPINEKKKDIKSSQFQNNQQISKNQSNSTSNSKKTIRKSLDELPKHLKDSPYSMPAIPNPNPNPTPIQTKREVNNKESGVVHETLASIVLRARKSLAISTNSNSETTSTSYNPNLVATPSQTPRIKQTPPIIPAVILPPSVTDVSKLKLADFLKKGTGPKEVVKKKITKPLHSLPFDIVDHSSRIKESKNNYYLDIEAKEREWKKNNPEDYLDDDNSSIDDNSDQGSIYEKALDSECEELRNRLEERLLKSKSQAFNIPIINTALDEFHPTSEASPDIMSINQPIMVQSKSLPPVLKIETKKTTIKEKDELHKIEDFDTFDRGYRRSDFDISYFRDDDN
jgi:hypothetical protein